MEINEIQSVQALINPEFLLKLYDTQNILEIKQGQAEVILKAKELGADKQIVDTILRLFKSYDLANEQLIKEYQARSRKKTGLELKYDGKGQPLQTISNFLEILRNDEYFDDVKFNLLTYAPERMNEDGKTIRWVDADDSKTREYIERKYNLANNSKSDDALRILLSEREYHPVKKLIDSIVWDGVERIPTLLSKWLKCVDNDYTREVSRLIFAGGIHRLYKPGCKFDDVPILIGKRQGEGKSTFVRWLAMCDEWFTEVNEFDGQKGMEALEGAWICELGELLALTKAKEVEAVKSYITRQVDKYRMPYDRRVTDHHRQCIFIGTTNKEQFLTDKTGNRRFYPVVCNQTGYDLFNNKEEIQNDIKQCWAEAKFKFEQGDMKPFADREIMHIIKAEQNKAVEDDYREGLIDTYIENKDEICVLELWKNALGNEYTKPSKKDSNDIGLILQNRDEWEKQPNPKKFDDFGSQRWWKRKNLISQQEIFKDLPFD